MSPLQKFLFYISMILSFATMVTGHAVIITSGLWFIPGKEKYNVFTRWVSDFAAVPYKGLWIKASILLFCVALLLLKRTRLRSCGDNAREHLRWFWNTLITFGLIGGLLLVILYDMSPPQYTTKDPSWLGNLLGAESWQVRVPKPPGEWVTRWYHGAGFIVFVVSFSLLLITTSVEKYRAKLGLKLRVDLACLCFTAISALLLFVFHTSQAGTFQRALLILIFWWVWTEGARVQRGGQLLTHS